MCMYYVIRPKDGLVLDVELCWKKAQECTGEGTGLALGLEMPDALNLASWVSFDGISASTYPETTACSLFEKDSDRAFFLNKQTFSHCGFSQAVADGFFPDFLLRKPSGKAEKKLFLKRYRKEQRSREKKMCDDSAVIGFSKNDLRGDNFYNKGAENMFYIVNMKKNLFLTKSLGWTEIGALRKNRKLMTQLFSVRDIEAAQVVSQWVTASGDTTSPCTSATLKRKFRLSFPNPTSDSLSDGIRSKKYPSFLTKKPESRKEVIAFQVALRSGLKNLEERTLLSLGKSMEPEILSAESDPINVELVVPADYGHDEDMLEEDLLSAESVSGQDSESFGFQHHEASVIESSELIRSIVECAISFGKTLSDASGLIAKKRLDFEMVKRQLIDLDHVAEFYSLNASDGYRLNKARKELLQRRRVIKDEIFVLELMGNAFNNGATPSSINSFVNGVMGLDHRRYTPRVLTVDDVKNLIRNPKTQEMILGISSDPGTESA